MQNYTVDAAYLDEKDAFDANEVLVNWRPSSNVFLKRSAAKAQVGFQGSLTIADFAEWVAEHVLSLPSHTGAALDLAMVSGPSGIQVRFSVVDRVPDIDSPIEADNPGFLEYALKWFATRRPTIRVYVTEGLFWVEGLK